MQGGEESSTEHAQQAPDDITFAARSRPRPVRVAAAHSHAVPGKYAAHDSEGAGHSYAPSGHHTDSMSWYDEGHRCAEDTEFVHRAPTETVQDCAGVLIRVHSQPSAIGENPADSSLAHAQSFGNFSLTSGASGSDAEGERSLQCAQFHALPSAQPESHRLSTSHYELAVCGGGGESSERAHGTLPGFFTLPSTHGAASSPTPWCLEWAGGEHSGSPNPMYSHCGGTGTGDDASMVPTQQQMAAWPGVDDGTDAGMGGLEEAVVTMHEEEQSGTLGDGLLNGALEDTNCGLPPGALHPLLHTLHTLRETAPRCSQSVQFCVRRASV